MLCTVDFVFDGYSMSRKFLIINNLFNIVIKILSYKFKLLPIIELLAFKYAFSTFSNLLHHCV